VAVRGWLQRHADGALAASLGFVFVAEMLFEADVDRRPASVAVAALFAATLAFRRRFPLAPLAVGIAIVELDNTLLKGIAEAGAFLVGFVIAIYTAGRFARGVSAWLSLAVVLIAIPVAAIEPGQPVGFADFGFFAMFFGGPFVVGRVIRHRRERERSLVAHATKLELDQELRAAEAVADERSRIARELHDVVAHAISVIVLQARGGRRMLDDAPEETRAALDTIEHAGGQALEEMRRLLGMLRASGDEIALAPQPSLSRLDELAARVTATGLPVEVRVEGTPVELPPGVDVSAYRIVQEALTNALKHAGPARAQVIVRYRPNGVELEVLDDGPGGAGGGGSGHGLAGIRERVGIYGGALESGQREGGGYALRVVLPLRPSR
jgi:signal transduction histidine kinase